MFSSLHLYLACDTDLALNASYVFCQNNVRDGGREKVFPFIYDENLTRM